MRRIAQLGTAKGTSGRRRGGHRSSKAQVGGDSAPPPPPWGGLGWEETGPRGLRCLQLA